MSIVYFN